MKTHIIGFTIFTFIIGSAVLIQSLFSAPQITVPAVADYEEDYSSAKNSCWRMKRKIVIETNVETSAAKTEKQITYELKDVGYDTVNNVLIGQIELSWNGQGKRPNAVAIDLNLFNTNSPKEKLSSGSQLILAPFTDEDVVTKSFAVKISNKNLIDTKKDYYAYADLNLIRNSEEAGGIRKGVLTRVILNEDEKMAQASPVLMIYGK